MKTLIHVMCVVALSVSYGATVRAQTAASAASADAPVHVVIYYEVVPADQAPAQGARPRQIFANYVDGARQEPGALAFEVLHDVEKHNRYVMLEVWRDSADFQQHMHAESSAQLAKTLQPWLIGPVDLRVNTELQ
jgi:quinol monooxygenase YgiN